MLSQYPVKCTFADNPGIASKPPGHFLPGGPEKPAELLDAWEFGAAETVVDILAHLLSGQAAYKHNILLFDF